MKYLLIAVLAVGIFSCNNGKNIPDVSSIQVDISTQQFEKDFFALDTNSLNSGLIALQKKYPTFYDDFITKILGVENSEQGELILKAFYRTYLPVYDSAKIVFASFDKYEKEIRKGLQFVKYYFPGYKIPGKIITFIGPWDASYQTSFGLHGDIITSDAIGIGLQLHLGKNFSFFKTEEAQQLYPDYISSRFEPATIAVNSMKNITDDLFPEKLEDKSLLQQMVEKGKRLYVLSKLLPEYDEYRLIGYSKQQLKECYQNEQEIWDLFIKNNLLQVTDENIVKNYIGESPKTQELGDASPGNIGAFAGWQIVKKYMEKNEKLSLHQLMATDDEILFREAKYKP